MWARSAITAPIPEPTWICIIVTGPTSGTSPLVWSTPLSNATPVNTARVSERPCAQPRRRIDRRAMSVFQGASRMIPNDKMPCPITTAVVELVPRAKLVKPVITAARSKMSNARLVRRPAMTSSRSYPTVNQTCEPTSQAAPSTLPQLRRTGHAIVLDLQVP